MTWSDDQLERIGAAEELEISTRRADGTLRGWVPIWVVRAGGQVYVRTWQRRDTGWFGRVVRSRQARVRVAGVELDVTVHDVGADAARAAVDAAYRTKYGRYGAATVARMVSGDAAAATLRLEPEAGPA
ncbi:DUF2255 family protein [Jatrophihabitans sp.]|uniref:DUF2255 family protein n=1 Tax=Jatrophihabitans sp. TaxID=1932789 RepID=UPI0030C69AD5|nr:hypothetical protein [Jatrophihabitans sp.]